MTERFANIVGWGKYTPEQVLTNADLERMVETSDEWIVQRTGIRERRIVSPDENTSDMAIAAARDALSMADVKARDLGLIIVATSSPDYLTPPVSSQIQHALGARNVGAFTLVAGCAGFVYALTTAQQYIDNGICDNVLVIGVELLSRFVDYTDRSTCVLFGDGAGAVVLQVSDEPAGVLSSVLGSDGSGAEHLILPAGGTAVPPTHESIEAGLTSDDIDLFIPHQANLRIIESAAKYVGFPEDKIFINIDRYGNTSAASIPIALVEAFEQGRAKVGDTLAFVAFGAGLSWAAAVVKVAERTLPIPFLQSRRKTPAWIAALNPMSTIVVKPFGIALGLLQVGIKRVTAWFRRNPD
jgi:3-oxoacyl-[acyl-carrier-protein] synthase-3